MTGYRLASLICLSLMTGGYAGPVFAQDTLYVRHMLLSSARLAANTPKPNDIAALEEALIDVIIDAGNDRRKEINLPAFTRDDALSELARNYSKRMRDEEFFGHTTLDGLGLADRIPLEQRRRFLRLGENLWSAEGELDWTSEAIAKQAAEDWMLSPSHRENLLEPTFSVAGVGVAIGENNVFVTMLYAMPQEAREDVMFVSVSGNVEPDAKPITPASFREGPIPAYPRAILDTLNTGRSKLGVSPVAAAAKLTEIAKDHAMASLVASRSAPTEDFVTRLNEDGARVSSASFAMWEAEGLLTASDEEIAQMAFRTWQDDGLILFDLNDPRFDSAGIGIARSADRTYVSVLLGQSVPIVVEAPTEEPVSEAPRYEMADTQLLAPTPVIALGRSAQQQAGDTKKPEINVGLHTRSGGRFIVID